MNLSLAQGKDDIGKKRKGASPVPGDRSTSAKKKSPDEKKIQGFDRGLEPEKILGMCWLICALNEFDWNFGLSNNLYIFFDLFK